MDDVSNFEWPPLKPAEPNWLNGPSWRDAVMRLPYDNEVGDSFPRKIERIEEDLAESWVLNKAHVEVARRHAFKDARVPVYGLIQGPYCMVSCQFPLFWPTFTEIWFYHDSQKILQGPITPEMIWYAMLGCDVATRPPWWAKMNFLEMLHRKEQVFQCFTTDIGFCFFLRSCFLPPRQSVFDVPRPTMEKTGLPMSGGSRATVRGPGKVIM